MAPSQQSSSIEHIATSSLRLCTIPPSRPNTLILFDVFNPSDADLVNSPSPFLIPGWEQLLRQYPDRQLVSALLGILKKGCRIGYDGEKQLILSKNLKSINLDVQSLQSTLDDDLIKGRVIHRFPTFPFISSPLGLVPKHDGGFRRIHHLSYPKENSVNAGIAERFASLKYTTFWAVLERVKRAGRHCYLLKRDIKSAFRNIPVATEIQWLLGFMWRDLYYSETCLPFGLRTAPFIFNLFAEALHWILLAYTQWLELEHYLDDYVLVVPPSLCSPEHLQKLHQEYNEITEVLGVPQNKTKDMEGTVIPVFGIEVDTTEMIARVPLDKISRVQSMCSSVLEHKSMSLHNAQKLAGLLSFCSQVVQLGWVYLRRIWDFIRDFPSGISRHARRRLPGDVRDDIEWWLHLFPLFNGIIFFGDERETVYLYTDASRIGLGGFYFSGFNGSWEAAASALPKTSLYARRSTQTNAATEEFNVNPEEVQAVLEGFKLWALLWQQKKVIVRTDNFTTASGLSRTTLKGKSNAPLREIMLLAAANDIEVHSEWIAGETNALADALSRFATATFTNLCPQFPLGFASLTHLVDG